MSALANRKPAVGFIFITLVMIMLGVGILIPILPGLITEFAGGSTASASHTYGWMLGVFSLMQFIMSPILGALSDRFGRRKVLLIALAGSAIDYVVMGLAPSLAWLFVARMISGMTAGSLATCNAYIADVTPPEKRAQGFGLVGAAFGLGISLGPLLGGFLGSINLRLPFFVAAGIVGLNWLYGVFLLPESLPPEKRRAFSWRRANPVGSLLVLKSFRGVFNLTGLYFLYMFANIMLQSVWVLYMGYRYSWSTAQVSLSLTIAGVSSAIVQSRLVKPILGRLGERRGLVAGLLVFILAMLGYGLAPQGWMIYVIIAVASFAGIAGPAMQSLLTRHVPPDQQGAVQGALSGLASLANIAGPILAAWSFGAAIQPGARWHLPGIAFFEAAAILLLALWLALRSFRKDDALAMKQSAG